jgi:hypothetical protein
MMIQYQRSLFTFGVALSLAAVQLSAAGVVGVASTRDAMSVNSASVRGTANISEGASVQTNRTPGQIRLQNGAQVTLGENSSATVHSDHIQLLQGTAQVTANQNYGLDALGYRMDGDSFRVAYDQNRILVTATKSAIKVSKDGELLASVNSGKTYYFEGGDAPGVPVPVKNTGKPVNAGSVAKTGLSTGAKWGIVAGAGAAAVGTVVGVEASSSSNNASR